MSKKSAQHKSESQVLERNIAAIHKVRADSDRRRSKDHELVDKIATFVGSTRCLYLHLLIYAIWSFVTFADSNSFNKVGQAASLESIFLAMFVLINQRRMNSIQRKSSDLHLQMSMIAEHEITRLAQITDLIAKNLKIDTSQVKDIETLKQDIHPLEIMKKISKIEQEKPTDSTSDGSII